MPDAEEHPDKIIVSHFIRRSDQIKTELLSLMLKSNNNLFIVSYKRNKYKKQIF